MNHTVLLRKLLAIERSIGNASNGTLRNLIYDAQNYLLEMQKERADTFMNGPTRDGSRQLHLLHNISKNRVA